MGNVGASLLTRKKNAWNQKDDICFASKQVMFFHPCLKSCITAMSVPPLNPFTFSCCSSPHAHTHTHTHTLMEPITFVFDLLSGVCKASHCVNQLPPSEKPKTLVLLPANVSRSMTLKGQVVAAS